MENKNEVREVFREIAEMLSSYLYGNLDNPEESGEGVVLIAPFLEVNKKLKEIADKHGVEENE